MKPFFICVTTDSVYETKLKKN